MVRKVTTAQPRRQVAIVRLRSGLMLAVYGADTPGSAEWKEYCSVMSTMGETDNMLIFSAGGGPNLMQRRDLEQITNRLRGSVAVVTASRVARGIVTAISWLKKEIKAFNPEQRQDAFTFLHLTPPQAEEALSMAIKLSKELGVSSAVGFE
jgi:hypothetical protein